MFLSQQRQHASVRLTLCKRSQDQQRKHFEAFSNSSESLQSTSAWVLGLGLCIAWMQKPRRLFRPDPRVNDCFSKAVLGTSMIQQELLKVNLASSEFLATYIEMTQTFG